MIENWDEITINWGKTYFISVVKYTQRLFLTQFYFMYDKEAVVALFLGQISR